MILYPNTKMKDKFIKTDLDVQTHLARIEKIYEHIQNVQENCYKLSKELIRDNQSKLARKLLQRGLKHDSSKFTDLEYFGMYSEDDCLKWASIENHRRNNEHHLEYHMTPLDMSEVDIAEMACDLKARSSEFGTDIREYVKTYVSERDISVNSKFYKSIIKYLNYILEDTLS